MNKKTYQQPEMKVVVLESTEILAGSTPATFGIKENEGYQEEEW